MKSLELTAESSELRTLLDHSIANTNNAIEVAQRLARRCEKLEQENQRLQKENTTMYLYLHDK